MYRKKIKPENMHIIFTVTLFIICPMQKQEKNYQGLISENVIYRIKFHSAKWSNDSYNMHEIETILLNENKDTHGTSFHL